MEMEIFSTGTHTSKNGITKTYTEADLDNIVNSYNPEYHEAPITIGHPSDNSPAYGWVQSLKRNGEKLIATVSDLLPEFKEMLEKKLFKKRSISLYPDGSLRHIGFLGALPPSVKGLKNLSFGDDEADELLTSLLEETVIEAQEGNDEAVTESPKVRDNGAPAKSGERFAEKKILNSTEVQDTNEVKDEVAIPTNHSEVLIDHLEINNSDNNINASFDAGINNDNDNLHYLSSLKTKISLSNNHEVVQGSDSFDDKHEKELGNDLSAASSSLEGTEIDKVLVPPALKTLDRELITSLLDSKISEGRFTPAMKKSFFAFIESPESTEQIIEFINSIPVIVHLGEVIKKSVQNYSDHFPGCDDYEIDSHSESIYKKLKSIQHQSGISFEAAINQLIKTNRRAL